MKKKVLSVLMVFMMCLGLADVAEDQIVHQMTLVEM